MAVVENSVSEVLDRRELRGTLDLLRGELLAQRTKDGHWTGELSASALSTATAISAMSAAVRSGKLAGADKAALLEQIQSGRRWLADQQNDDGGFGDTDRSHSNIATSYLVLAAWTLSDQVTGETTDANAISRLRNWIQLAGELDGLRRRYGKDKTFVVPILTNMRSRGWCLGRRFRRCRSRRRWSLNRCIGLWGCPSSVTRCRLLSRLDK